MSDSDLLMVSMELSRSLKKISFGDPVAGVYDPTEYARGPFGEYLQRFGQAPKYAVFVGMNPGPWGMVQTGVPFGDAAMVKTWMGIGGKVGSPAEPHPKRPVQGFGCERREISGTRFWGWAAGRFGTAEGFFRRFFVLNYCPLAFFDTYGRNLTPERLKADARASLFYSCDEAVRRQVEILAPDVVVGIGHFAFERCGKALKDMDLKVGRITHPSPANPRANRGWDAVVERELAEMGLDLHPETSGV